MSALRLGRLPDGTRDIRILEPAVGRISFTRGAIRNAGEYVVAKSTPYHAPDKRVGKHAKVTP